MALRAKKTASYFSISKYLLTCEDTWRGAQRRRCPARGRGRALPGQGSGQGLGRMPGTQGRPKGLAFVAKAPSA